MPSRKYRFYSADARRSKLHIACSDFFKSQSALIALLLLSKSNPLRWASIWFWAQSRTKIDFTHLLQVHVVKMLSCPSSQCFQRIRGPRKVKSEGREILLSASCFPKQEGLALTRPPSCIALPQTCPAKDKEILCAFDAAPMAQAGPKGAAFFCPLNCCQRIPNSGKLAIC